MKDYSFWGDVKLIDRFAKMRAACENPQWKEMSITWMKLLHKKAGQDYFEMKREFNSNKICSNEFINEYARLSTFYKLIPKYIEEVEKLYEYC